MRHADEVWLGSDVRYVCTVQDFAIAHQRDQYKRNYEKEYEGLDAGVASVTCMALTAIVWTRPAVLRNLAVEREPGVVDYFIHVSDHPIVPPEVAEIVRTLIESVDVTLTRNIIRGDRIADGCYFTAMPVGEAIPEDVKRALNLPPSATVASHEYEVLTGHGVYHFQSTPIDRLADTVFHWRLALAPEYRGRARRLPPRRMGWQETHVHHLVHRMRSGTLPPQLIDPDFMRPYVADEVYANAVSTNSSASRDVPIPRIFFSNGLEQGIGHGDNDHEALVPALEISAHPKNLFFDEIPLKLYRRLCEDFDFTHRNVVVPSLSRN